MNSLTSQIINSMVSPVPRAAFLVISLKPRGQHAVCWPHNIPEMVPQTMLLLQPFPVIIHEWFLLPQSLPSVPAASLALQADHQSGITCRSPREETHLSIKFLEAYFSRILPKRLLQLSMWTEESRHQVPRLCKPRAHNHFWKTHATPPAGSAAILLSPDHPLVERVCCPFVIMFFPWELSIRELTSPHRQMVAKHCMVWCIKVSSAFRLISI